MDSAQHRTYIRRNRTGLASAMVAMGCLVAGVPCHATPPTVEDVLSSYESACAMISSFDVYARFTPHPQVASQGNDVRPLTLAEKQKPGSPPVLSRQQFGRERFRSDVLQAEGRSHPLGTIAMVWDGSTVRSLTVPFKEAFIDRHQPGRGMQGISYFELYLSYFPGMTYLEMLRGRSTAAYSVEQKGGKVILLARAEPQREGIGTDRGLRFTFDPARGFMPERIEYLLDRSGEQVPWTIYENTLAEVEPGLWVPVHTRRSTLQFKRDSQMFGQVLGYEELEIDRGRSRFNQPIDDQTFQLPFPIGTTVHDQVTNSEYLIGEENRQSHLDRLALQGRFGIEQLNARFPQEMGIRSPERTVWRTRSLLLVNALMIVLAIGLTFWKHRRPLVHA